MKKRLKTFLWALFYSTLGVFLLITLLIGLVLLAFEANDQAMMKYERQRQEVTALGFNS